MNEAITASDIVVVNVIDGQAANDLLRTEAVAAALRGKLLVQLTSGSPSQARETADWATRHGVKHLDGAIMATPNFIGEPGATILYSGPRDLFDENCAALKVLGGNTAHVGEDSGHASALDIALLSHLWGALFGSLQAIAVCEAEGIALDAFSARLGAFMPVVSGAVDDLLVRAKEGRYAGDDETLANIAAHHGAFQHLLEICAERKLNRSVSDAFDSVFRAAIARGHVQDDFAALVPFMR